MCIYIYIHIYIYIYIVIVCIHVCISCASRLWPRSQLPENMAASMEPSHNNMNNIVNTTNHT